MSGSIVRKGNLKSWQQVRIIQLHTNGGIIFSLQQLCGSNQLARQAYGLADDDYPPPSEICPVALSVTSDNKPTHHARWLHTVFQKLIDSGDHKEFESGTLIFASEEDTQMQDKPRLT